MTGAPGGWTSSGGGAVARPPSYPLKEAFDDTGQRGLLVQLSALNMPPHERFPLLAQLGWRFDIQGGNSGWKSAITCMYARSQSCGNFQRSIAFMFVAGGRSVRFREARCAGW